MGVVLNRKTLGLRRALEIVITMGGEWGRCEAMSDKYLSLDPREPFVAYSVSDPDETA